MRANENIKIIGKLVVLIPYTTKHVPIYHNWMQNKELLEATASDVLTLEEEYAMQRSWHEDEDKCCFLILCRDIYESCQDELTSLIGDTNLFLHYSEDNNELTAEAEIMIAECQFRGKGYGWEAILLMLKYGQMYLNVKRFIAKIGIDNFQSINLFKKIQFIEVEIIAIFREITFHRPVSAEWIKWLDEQVEKYQIDTYHV